MAIGTGTALALGAGAGLLGSAIQSNAAKSAAQTSANAQLESARLAAEQAKFRPVGITSRFGQSQFGFSPEGYLTSAGYTVSPEIKAIQDRLMAQAGQATPEQLGQVAQAGLMPGAQGLFNLGQQYLAQSPEEAAQRYMTSQQALLAPGREQALANTRNQLFQAGRQGLATGGTTAGGLQQTNPEMAAYYNALAQQDAQLAAQAEQAGQQRTSFGAGLFGTGAQLLGNIPSLTTAGYGPLQTQLGLASTIENLGQTPLDLGAQLGGRAAQAGGTAANALLQGGLGAARTQQAANAYNPLGTALSSFGQTGTNAAMNAWFQQQLNPQGGYTPGAIPGWSGSTISPPVDYSGGNIGATSGFSGGEWGGFN